MEHTKALLLGAVAVLLIVWILSDLKTVVLCAIVGGLACVAAVMEEKKKSPSSAAATKKNGGGVRGGAAALTMEPGAEEDREDDEMLDDAGAGMLDAENSYGTGDDGFGYGRSYVDDKYGDDGLGYVDNRPDNGRFDGDKPVVGEVDDVGDVGLGAGDSAMVWETKGAKGAKAAKVVEEQPEWSQTRQVDVWDLTMEGVDRQKENPPEGEMEEEME